MLKRVVAMLVNLARSVEVAETGRGLGILTVSGQLIPKILRYFGALAFLRQELAIAQSVLS